MAALALLIALAPSRVPSASVGSGSSSGYEAIAYPPGDAPGDPGTAASGVICGPGVRQVPWSHYAPICQPAFPAGASNGGATAPGVSATTITLTFRYAASSAESQEISTIAPDALGTKAEAITLMNQYISLFNSQFDLYGRHVVLKEFDGKGDILQEASGLGQEQALADAATAKSLGAFADVSTLFNTPQYDDALAAQHIISIGGAFESKAALASQAPYEYTPGPDCDKAAEGTAAVVERSLAGLPAIFAGDPAMVSRPRKFALISPDNPVYIGCTQALVKTLQDKFRLPIQWIRYSVDLTGAANEATNIVAQLRSGGTTTVLCGCDPITPLYLSKDATAQGYRPEWFSLGFGDAFNRLPDQSQWAHDLAGGEASIPLVDQEAYTAWRLALAQAGQVLAPGTLPPPSYEGIYEPLLLFFDALEAAGPDLTPKTFQAGFDSLPASLPGAMFGAWQFGPGTVDPAASFQMLRWDPAATSLVDGRKGTFVPCNGGQSYFYSTAASTLPDHRQLQCPAVSSA